jgi:hypothetical protein
MSKELSQAQLERLVVGEEPDPHVQFFDRPVLNMRESKAQGRRVYRKATFVKKTHPGVTDWTAYEATKEDINEFPDQYQEYLRNRQGVREVGVDIIPNLDITHLQELLDYRLNTIPKLAEAVHLPPHLAYAQKAAIMINKTLQEARNGEEESHEESEHQEGTAEVVSAPDRQEHPVDVGRPSVPTGQPDQVSRRAERVHEGRRKHDHQGLNPIDNWNITGSETFTMG